MSQCQFCSFREKDYYSLAVFVAIFWLFCEAERHLDGATEEQSYIKTKIWAKSYKIHKTSYTNS